jgi:hypothetical protein
MGWIAMDLGDSGSSGHAVIYENGNVQSIVSILNNQWMYMLILLVRTRLLLRWGGAKLILIPS